MVLLRLQILFATLLATTATCLSMSTSPAQATTYVASTRGETLYKQGSSLYKSNKFKQAIQVWQQALVAYQQAGDRLKESLVLSRMSFAYYNTPDYPNALSTAERAYTSALVSGNLDMQSLASYALCSVYGGYGRYPDAADACERGLKIAQQTSDNQTQAQILRALAEEVYTPWAKYDDALKAYERGRALARKVKNAREEGRLFTSEGFLYIKLASYDRARMSFNEALKIARKNGYVEEISWIQSGLSLIEFSRTYGNSNISDVEASICKGIYEHVRKLDCFRREGAKKQEISELLSHGSDCQMNGDIECAFTSFSQSLALSEEIGAREGVARILSRIGNLFADHNQPEMAIIFLKRSVSLYELIRAEARFLPQDLQDSYVKTIADTYRYLADLLLQADRVLEAQQVLDLLKVQELKDYLRTVRASEQSVYELPPEQVILKKYDAEQASAIQLGQELTSLRKIPASSRTSAQEERIKKLVQLQDELNQQFNQFITRADVVTLVKQLTPTAVRQTVDLAQLDGLRNDLRQLNAALLYPLVLDDRLELIITTPDSPPLRRTVTIKRTELNAAITEFRSVLRNPSRDPKPIAQKLYTWLIKPLEKDLQQSNAQTIIYAPDAQLRYIPLQALHDGQQWLVQRYRVNNITAQSFTEFKTQPVKQLHILAGAFASGQFQFQVGDRTIPFAGLPFAGKEVEALASQFPNTTKLIDRTFSRDTTTTQMNEFSVVHLATHASFVPGTPIDSFIVFGNGDRATLQDIGSWSLNNVDLVVLSACETGLGGKFGNGEEILGLGYQFQTRGAKAAIASLWTVDDGGTQALMTAFYEQLKLGKVTKAEALRQAQIALINANTQTNGVGKRSSIAIELLNSGVSQTTINRLSHPYYWAPFILIGNGL